LLQKAPASECGDRLQTIKAILLAPIGSAEARSGSRVARSANGVASARPGATLAQMAEVEFDDGYKRYADGFEAVKHLDLDVRDGELMVLVGPSGSGKSTALRMVAGLEDISQGEVRIGGEVVNDRAPRDRDIATGSSRSTSACRRSGRLAAGGDPRDRRHGPARGDGELAPDHGGAARRRRPVHPARRTGGRALRGPTPGMTHCLQTSVVNPLVRLAFRLGIPDPGDALLETIGRHSGQPRLTPVCDGLEGDTFWLIAQSGRDAD
jgi:energy-coupling factor transporter ATP-binding protein EcfA2